MHGIDLEFLRVAMERILIAANFDAENFIYFRLTRCTAINYIRSLAKRA